nr:hypothetical protein [Herbihabitans rhizosphaerae]
MHDPWQQAERPEEQTGELPRVSVELPPVHEAWLPREHSLHRPRHGTRQLTALICALVFFAGPAALWVFGGRPSELENHKLASFPGLDSGWAFFTGLGNWATDQLVFRGGAIDAADWISRTLFGEPPPLDQGGRSPVGPLPNPPGGIGGVPNPPNVEGPTPGVPGTEGFRRVIEGSDGWLYFGYDTDAKCQPTKPLAESIAGLNRLRDAITASGRKLVLVVAPDKTTMVPEHLPGTYPGRDCANAAAPELWRAVTKDAKALDVRPALQAAGREAGRPVYHQQDTHWTDEGSVAMVRAVAEHLSPGVTATWQVSDGKPWSGGADLATMVGKRAKKEGMAYEIRPDGFNNRSQDPVKPGMAQPTHRQSDPVGGTIDKPTTVIGDSFTEITSKYLPAAFSNVTMQSYMAINDTPTQVANQMANSEIVVLQVVERNIAGGILLPFTSDMFIETLRPILAARPVR